MTKFVNCFIEYLRRFFSTFINICVFVNKMTSTTISSPFHRCSLYLCTKKAKTLGVVATISFTEGLISCFDVVQSYYYKDDYRLQPSESALYNSLLLIPWILKPVLGLVSDNIFLFGYRRKSYLIIAAFINYVCLANLGFWTPSLAIFLTLLMISNTCLCFQNVVTQALIVRNTQEITKESANIEKSKLEAASSGISIFFGTKYIGKVVCSILIMTVLNEQHKSSFMLGFSFFFLSAAFITFFLPENKRTESQSLLNQDNISPSERGPSLYSDRNEDLLSTVVRPLGEPAPDRHANNKLRRGLKFFKNPAVLKIMLLMFLSRILPDSGQAKFFFFTTQLKFDKSDLGLIKLISCSAIILSIFIYNRFLSTINIKKFYTWTLLICSLLSLSQLIIVYQVNIRVGISNLVFAAIDTFVIDLGNEFASLPLLVMACRICPKDIEATIFAVFVSVLNLGVFVSQEIGALIVSTLGIKRDNFDNLDIAVLINAASHLIPFTILWMIKFEDTISHSNNT